MRKEAAGCAEVGQGGGGCPVFGQASERPRSDFNGLSLSAGEGPETMERLRSPFDGLRVSADFSRRYNLAPALVSRSG